MKTSLSVTTRFALLIAVVQLSTLPSAHASDLDRACQRSTSISETANKDATIAKENALSSKAQKAVETLTHLTSMRSTDNAKEFEGGHFSWGFVKERSQVKMADIPQDGRVLWVDYDPTDYTEESHNKNHSWQRNQLLFVSEGPALIVYGRSVLIEKPKGLFGKFNKPAVVIDGPKPSWKFISKVSPLSKSDSNVIFMDVNATGSASLTVHYVTSGDKEICKSIFVPKGFF